MTHEYDRHCMCNECHTHWESLIRSGDTMTINAWVNDMNGDK